MVFPFARSFAAAHGGGTFGGAFLVAGGRDTREGEGSDGEES